MSIHSILTKRLKEDKEKEPKMASLAKKSASGQLSSFAGIFGQAELNPLEKESLLLLLKRFAKEGFTPEQDFTLLSSLTLEIRAISNQAALLHGERIKRAQELLKNYQEGAFTAWLLHTYGNRQTPYNFLQYYEFYLAISKELHPLVESMPRQAVYALASREGSLEQKEHIVKEAAGKTKEELLHTIRNTFPLATHDKRGRLPYLRLLSLLEKAVSEVQMLSLDSSQKKQLSSLLTTLKAYTKC